MKTPFLFWKDMAFPYIPFLLVGLYNAFRSRRIWLLFFVWVVLYIISYSLLQVSWYYWYGVTTKNIAFLFVGIGCATLVSWSEPYLRANYIKGMASLCFIIFLVAIMTQSTRWAYGSISPLPIFPHRYPAYRQIAAWLRQNASPDEVVAAPEIGYLGFFTEQPIFDLNGLVSPLQLERMKSGDFTSQFWKTAPTFAIELEYEKCTVSHLLFDSARFRSGLEYEKIATFKGTDPRASCTLYRKRQAHSSID